MKDYSNVKFVNMHKCGDKCLILLIEESGPVVKAAKLMIQAYGS